VSLVLAIAIAFILGALIAGGSRHRGRSSLLGLSERPHQLETTSRKLRLFEFRGLIVSDDRGTTEVDLVVVGNAGVFVVEEKRYNAWIFGVEGDERWTARYADGSTHQFQNPLRQNFRHVMALRPHLGVDEGKVYSLVSFSGDCRLMPPTPPNVSIGYEDRVRGAEGIKLTDDEVLRVCDVLRSLRTRSTDAAFDQHVEDLRKRYSSATVCPKCGSRLVERRSTKPTSDGKPFLGCTGYPKCTYIRKLDPAPGA
jgi:restriction system protein